MSESNTPAPAEQEGDKLHPQGDDGARTNVQEPVSPPIVESDPTTEQRDDEEIQVYGDEAGHDASTTAAVAEPPAAAEPPVVVESTPKTSTGGGGGKPPGSGGGGGDDDGEEEEERMSKMSFLEHLEELRKRIIHALIAVAVAFFICFAFAQQLFERMSEPLRQALRAMKTADGRPMSDALYFTKPTDAFTLYINLALVAGLFLASPVVLYEVWAFISPGLYKRERKYAVPFVFFCSGLFIAGGLFGYFIAFPYALDFLINYGGPHVVPWITVTEYMDMFWTVMLGLGIVFELPVLMLFLGLLGIITPGFLLRNFRYAVLVIFIVAAVVTPTSDITNMMIFAMPMLGLYMVGVGLVWIVSRRRRRRKSEE